jgi:chromosomal replication initiator protein
MNAIWKSAKRLLKEQVPDHTYRMWIDPIASGDSDADTVVLVCPNLFSKRRIWDQYRQAIEDAVAQAAGQAVAIRLVVQSNPVRGGAALRPDRQLKLPAMDLPPNGGRLLRKDFTFDQFVVGKNSDFAYSAALSLAARQQGSQNALYLLARTGLGKSHLSQAVGHHILQVYPSERVYYITAEDFMNEMSDSYRTKNIHQFKEKYRRNCDVLLLEDVHFLSEKKGTQRELSNTLESLMNANKKIIYSSSYVPSEIPGLTDELKSRLCCGLVSKIDTPDYQTRLRILKKATQANGAAVADEVLQYLASELTGDVRQLKSGLIGTTAKASLLGCDADLSLARSVVRNMVASRDSITLDTIKNLVCKYYNVTLSDLVSRSRRQSIVRPRQVAMYLSRQYTDHSLQAIGKSFNRYHATAMHALKVVEMRVRENGPCQKQIAFLSQRLEKGAL